MNIEQPLVSIITVVYNAVDTIEKTISSVIDHACSRIEYIIIDGGSTDGTLNIIDQYKDKLSYYISEKDNGIYHAMNKGIVQCAGRFVYFINAGDLCYTIPFTEIQNSDADLICFPVQLSNGEILYPAINDTLKIKNTLHHQGCYYKNTANLSYDTNYRIFSDFALNQTYYKLKKNIIVRDHPIVGFHDIGGISHDKKFGSEIFKVVYDHYGWKSVVRSFLHFKWNGLKDRFQKVKNV